jgi:hypothetical protein
MAAILRTRLISASGHGMIAGRERSVANSFNVLRIDRSQVIVERFIWNADTGGLDGARREPFVRPDDGWKALIWNDLSSQLVCSSTRVLCCFFA